MNIPEKIQNQNNKLRDKMGRKEANSLKHRFQESTGAIISSLISNSLNFLKSISISWNERKEIQETDFHSKLNAKWLITSNVQQW